MRIDTDRQNNAQRQVQALMEEAELQRRRSRIDRGITELSLGRYDLLTNDELVRHLPEQLHQMLKGNTYNEGVTVLNSLGKSFTNDSQAMRERAVMVLSILTAKIAESKKKSLLRHISGLLADWLERETEFISGYETVCNQIEFLARWLIERNRWPEAERLVQPIYRIRSGTLIREANIRSIAGRTLNRIASKAVVIHLLAAHASETEKNETIQTILFCLGKPVAPLALSIMVESDGESEKELYKILISELGQHVVPFLSERLESKPSVPEITAIISILEQMADPDLSDLVEPYLLHSDAGVFNAALECIGRISGHKLSNYTVTPLYSVEDPRKRLIIKRLAKCDDPNVAESLQDLLVTYLDKKNPVSGELLSTLTAALGKFPSNRTLNLLRRLETEFSPILSDSHLQQKINHTLLDVQSQVRHSAHTEPGHDDDISFSVDPTREQKVKNQTREFEDELQSLVNQGEVDLATERVFEKCVELAREKDFDGAERMRDKILKLSRQALDKVIEVEEIILAEKASAIPGSHLETWQDLQRALGQEGYELLYDGLKKEQFQEGEEIAREGERDERLYFINSGTIAISCRSGERETFLRRIKAGEIVGAEQFFSVSVWTVSVRANSEVQLHVLDREACQELQSLAPEVFEKLQDFCQSENHVLRLLKMSGKDRRNTPRYAITAPMNTVLFDSYGGEGNRVFVSQMQDISQGGGCFVIGITKSENARLLLGRQVKISIKLTAGLSSEFMASVVGVEPCTDQHQRYRVHVKMIEMLTAEQVRQIVAVYESKKQD